MYSILPSKLTRTLAAAALALAAGMDPTGPAYAVTGSMAGVPITDAGAVALDANEADQYSIVFDSKRGFLYFSTFTFAPPNRIVKVRAATATQPAARVASADLPDGVFASDGQSLALDEEGGFLYHVFSATPSKVVKYAVGEGDAPPTLIGATELAAGDDDVSVILFDPVANRLVLGVGSTTPRAILMDAGDANTPPLRVASADLNTDEHTLRAGAIDPGTRRAYLVTETPPSIVVQVGYDPAAGTITRETALALPDAKVYYKAAFDPLTQRMFLNTVQLFGSPDVVRVIDVSGAEPRLTSALLTDPAASPRGNESIAIDPANGIGFSLSRAREFGPRDLMKFALGGDRFSGPAILQEHNPSSPALIFTGAEYDARNGFLYALTGVGDDLALFQQPKAPGPDLTGEWQTIKTAGKPGKFKANGRLTVRNEGTAEAGPFEVHLFRSSDRLLSHDDVRIGRPARVKKLAPGAVRNVNLKSGVTPASFAGQHLIAVIDPLNTTDDGNLATNRVVSDRLP